MFKNRMWPNVFDFTIVNTPQCYSIAKNVEVDAQYGFLLGILLVKL